MSQTEHQTYEALVRDTQRRLYFLRKSPVVVFDILNGERRNLFALVCFLVSALFWLITSSWWQTFTIFIVTSLLIIFYVDALRDRIKGLISQDPALKHYFDSLVDAWAHHSPANDSEIVLTADIIIEKLSALYATILLALGRLQNQQQYQLPLAIGGVSVVIALFVWNYFLSLLMTIYWMVIALLLWPQLHRYHGLQTLHAIMQFYREQLELSFIPGQRSQDLSDPKADDGSDVMFAISDELTGQAFGTALGEELGYETHETHEIDVRQPVTEVEDKPRMVQRHDSLYGLEVDEMPSVAAGDDDNSDDEWAFDAETPSLAEEMHFTAGLEFPSLSQDSIDYHQAVQRREDKRRAHSRSQLADLPEHPSPVVGLSPMVNEEIVMNEATSTPVMSASGISSRSSVMEKSGSAEMPYVETGHSPSSESSLIRRRRLPQIPQPSKPAGSHSLDTVEVDTIYIQKGLRPNSSLTAPMSTSLQPEMSFRVRSVASAPVAVSPTESVNDWNFQESSMAVGKSLNDKEKLDMSEFDIPDQSEIDNARSAEKNDKPSSWLFG